MGALAVCPGQVGGPWKEQDPPSIKKMEMDSVPQKQEIDKRELTQNLVNFL